MKSKVVLLIGHRGVGKTSLLGRIKSYCAKYNIEASTVDLDHHIEQRENKSIADIFANDGEKKFRSLEKKYLIDLVQNTDTKILVSIGAGFMGPYPEDAEIIFIKRDTDKHGRTFLDRPRLNTELSAFEEYKDLYNKREQHYSGTAHLTLVLQEGLKENTFYEELFFGFAKDKLVTGVYTLLPGELEKVEFYLSFGLDKIEIRTDYFGEEDITKLINSIPEEKLLLSVRDKKIVPTSKYMDWPLEFGAPEKKYFIISNHNKDNGIEESISKLEQSGSLSKHLKLAIPIDSLEELKIGHEWHLKNPSKNCFLPISKDGKFAWYRLIQKNNIFPNFFKTTGQGSALDQPYFYDWVNNNFDSSNGFAAIIGWPVNHSWTPNEHYKFFAKYKMPVVKINLQEYELTKENFNFLASLGLKAAAVTSPLKNKIAQVIFGAEEPINTIVSFAGEWKSTNTDIDGFEVLAGYLKTENNIVLWGGGGVITSVKQVLPEVSSYSARTGSARKDEVIIDQPEVVIWAVGRHRLENWPDSSWRPHTIVDLNYSEDSPGKEYALMVGAKYISGESMFTGQAQKQQEFWSEYL